MPETEDQDDPINFRSVSFEPTEAQSYSRGSQVTDYGGHQDVQRTAIAVT